MNKKLVYLDHAATTPVDPEVVLAMEPYWEAANPSSLHRCGQEAIKAVDEARETIAKFVGALLSREIVFTGSATEANNLAIRGTTPRVAPTGSPFLIPKGYPSKRATRGVVRKPHIITTAIEHASVLEPIRALARLNCAPQIFGGREKMGAIEVTILPVGMDGVVSADAVASAVKENTALVSIGYANNEIGMIQPIAQIVRAVKAKNPKTLIHTDAVQAAPWLDIDIKNLSVDLMTISAHKMYGPKGVGALYIKDGIKLEPVIYGGGQEYGLRAGTENVPGIVGFAKAVELTKKWKEDAKNVGTIKELRDYAWQEIHRSVPGAELNGHPFLRLPNNLNIFIPGVDPETFLIALSEDGICVSSGSACASRSQTLSHVIRAIGKGDTRGCHLRITLGRRMMRRDLDALIAAIKKRLP